jgi:precorrin-2/cobalt-factor-2 C20-methyltransferase
VVGAANIATNIAGVSGTRLVGVGVGPGDPELVTVKAVRVLAEADVVFVPVSDAVPGRPYDGGAGLSGAGAGEPGRAEMTVRAHVSHDRIVRLPFQMTGDADYSGPAARVADAAAARPGGLIAFATIGDPNVYSTFTTLAARVLDRLPGLRIQTVPGITAMQDLAARSGTVLAVGSETVALLPLTAGVEAYERALADHDTVVAYKGGRALPHVVEVLAKAGRLDGPAGAATYGAALGLADEDIRPVRELDPDAPGPYLSTVIATRRSRWPA